MVRTRFAPSPTGYLHIGGARTALFAWAYARRHGGTFILRIEDTDLERSTPQAVQAILDGMNWLALDCDEGPFYQTRRMDRYREVIETMLADGTAYRCYTSPAELEATREAQRQRGEKPRYDGRWRPEPGKALPPLPQDVRPVVRFRNPTAGKVAWDDHVKGRIEFDNGELDDLVIARADGSPTYNFCVCVDDWDMGITHVIRGDDHVNNTPRQINILRALGAAIPEYAHLSMILGDDGQKLSKRHGAVSVMQYDDDGFLPEAVVNYLARLGWSHGDDEIFTRKQFVEWFDLDHITPSAAQFNTEKLLWLNQQYLRQADVDRLQDPIRRRLTALGVDVASGPDLGAAIRLYQDRCNTLNALADALAFVYRPATPAADDLSKFVGAATRPALLNFVDRLESLAWQRETIGATVKETASAHGLKMPQLAMPLRLALTGQGQTPSVDALVELIGPELVRRRIRALADTLA